MTPRALLASILARPEMHAQGAASLEDLALALAPLFDDGFAARWRRRCAAAGAGCSTLASTGAAIGDVAAALRAELGDLDATQVRVEVRPARAPQREVADATNAIDLLRRIAVEYERTGEALTRSDAEGEILRGVIGNGWAMGHMLRTPPRTGLYSCAPTRAGLRFLGGVDGQPYWYRSGGDRVLELGPLRIEVAETVVREGDGERPAWIVSVPGVGDDLDRPGAATVEEAKARGIAIAVAWLRDAGPRLAASLPVAS